MRASFEVVCAPFDITGQQYNVLRILRGALTSVGVIVLPQEVTVTFAEDKFAGDGEEMTDEKTKGNLQALGAALVEMLRRMHATETEIWPGLIS